MATQAHITQHLATSVRCREQESLLQMALRVTRCYSNILTNTGRCGHPSMLLQTFSRPPKLPCCSSRLFSSATSNFNSNTSNIVRFSFRNWSQYVRPRYQPRSRYSNEAGGSGSSGSTTSVKALYSTDRIKVILREYGTVAVVFHTAISLFSLGSCYLVVNR